MILYPKHLEMTCKMVCIDLYHSGLLSLIKILIKVALLQQTVPIMSINLITWGEFGEILPNDFEKCSELPIYYLFKW